jgi:hypothetical protein
MKYSAFALAAVAAAGMAGGEAGRGGGACAMIADWRRFRQHS